MTRKLPNAKRLFSGFIIFCLALLVYFFEDKGNVAPVPPKTESYTFTELHVFEQALINRRNSIQVTQYGEIHRILRDDNEGSRHQRLIVKLSSGQTVLIAHNIDLAPRVPGVEIGQTIIFHGEYESNKQGGVIHWTHHDPAGRHKDGWLEYQGRRYQ